MVYLLFVLLFVLYIYLIVKINRYAIESRYIKIEIRRTSGREREEWKRRLRKLRRRIFFGF